MWPKTRTVQRSTMFCVCLTGLMWMVAMYVTGITKSPPLGTASESVDSELELFDTLAICSSGWRRKGSMEDVFPLSFSGYGIFIGKIKHIDNDELQKLMTASEVYTGSRREFLDAVNQVYQAHGADGSQIDLYNPFSIQYACGVVRQHPKILRGSVIGTFDAIDLKYENRYTIILPQGGRRGRNLRSISFYLSTSMDYIGPQHYVGIDKPVDDNKDHYQITFRVELVKYKNLRFGKTPCSDTPKGTVHPVGYAETECRKKCHFQATEKTYGCAPLPWYWESNQKHPPCHGLGLRNAKNESADREHAEKTDACIIDHRCSDRRLCEEWSIRMIQQSTRESGIHEEPPPNRTIEVVVMFDQKQTVVRQFILHPWTEIMGNVGGLVGIWVGVSVFAVFDALRGLTVSLIKWKNKAVDAEDRNAA